MAQSDETRCLLWNSCSTLRLVVAPRRGSFLAALLDSLRTGVEWSLFAGNLVGHGLSRRLVCSVLGQTGVEGVLEGSSCLDAPSFIFCRARSSSESTSAAAFFFGAFIGLALPSGEREESTSVYTVQFFSLAEFDNVRGIWEGGHSLSLF